MFSNRLRVAPSKLEKVFLVLSTVIVKSWTTSPVSAGVSPVDSEALLLGSATSSSAPQARFPLSSTLTSFCEGVALSIGGPSVDGPIK